MSIWQKLFGIDIEAPEPSQAKASLDQRPVANVKGIDSTNKIEKEDLQMQDELITSDNLSPELLQSIFDAAFMDSTLDDDGNITVQDAVRVNVRVNMERKDRIRFFSVFGFKKDSTPLERLEGVNRINNDFIVICASAEGDALVFRHDIWVDGGITKKNMIKVLKRFATIPHGAVEDCCQGIVE